jgi:rare lipoprotein A
VGIASWYGKKFHGHLTSNGEIYNMYGMSAAHKNLPLPTYLKVTNLANSKSVIVRVNDRGPFHQNRIIDLSYSAAYKLDMLKTGTAKVKISAITEFGQKNAINPSLPQLQTTTNKPKARLRLTLKCLKQIPAQPTFGRKEEEFGQ